MASLSDIAAGDCIPERVGDTWKQSSTSASTDTAGVSMSSVIGINLSSETGYSTSAELQLHMNSTGHPVCGLHALTGQGTPGLLQVHSSVIT